MPLCRYLRSEGYGPIAGRRILICASLLFLLFLRVGPPRIPPAPSAHHTFNSAAQEQRPCYDHDAFQWLSPARAFAWTPEVRTSYCRTRGIDAPFVCEPTGFYYNRPPPVS